MTVVMLDEHTRHDIEMPRPKIRRWSKHSLRTVLTQRSASASLLSSCTLCGETKDLHDLAPGCSHNRWRACSNSTVSRSRIQTPSRKGLKPTLAQTRPKEAIASLRCLSVSLPSIGAG